MNPTYDMPQNYYFGGGGDTFAPPLAIVILLLAAVLILLVRKRYVLVPMIAAGILLPYGVNIAVAGIHFPMDRLLVGVVWLRFFFRRECALPKLNAIDKCFLLWALSNALAFSLLWSSVGAIINRLGFLWTTLGSYFLLRALIRTKEDISLVSKIMAVIIMIVAPSMLFEHVSRFNAFSILGAPAFADIRDGAIRARGPFGHAIIAGTIAAALMPVFVGLWLERKGNRRLFGLAILGTAVMTVSSASSTPIITFASGVLGLLLWRFRDRLRTVRWLAIGGLVAVQLAMSAPIWFLLKHVGGTLGGSGYHRSMLIDNFVRHFADWWLIGTRDNVSWGYDMWDVDNAYVAAGLGGGLATFVLFIAIIGFLFRRISKSLRLARKSRHYERVTWSLGSALFASTVGFFGILYFDQSILLWYSVLAMISATPALVAAPGTENVLYLRNKRRPAGSEAPLLQVYPETANSPQ